MRRKQSKRGDVLVCRDADDSDGVLVVGAYYLVVGAGAHHVVLDGVETTRPGGWDDARFDLAFRAGDYTVSLSHGRNWIQRQEITA